MQVGPGRREGVFDQDGAAAGDLAAHDALGLELLEALREQVVRDSRDRLADLPEAPGPAKEHAHDLRVPAAAEDLGGALEVLADRPLRFHHPPSYRANFRDGSD